MADYAAIRDGLKTALEGITNVKVAYDTVPDRVIVPSMVVQPGNPVAGYHESFDGAGGGLVALRYEVVALAGRWEPGAGQGILDGFILGAGSVPTAIAADVTLGGTAIDTQVVSCLDYGNISVADSQYYGCRFIVEIKVRL